MTTRMFRGLTIACGLAAILTTAAAHPAGAEELRWKFTPKKAYKFTFTETNNSKAEVQGQAIETKVVQTLETTWDIQEVARDGTATMTQTITRFKIASQNPFQMFEYDTSAPGEPEAAAAAIAPVMKALVGSPIELKMSRLGVVSDVKIPASMVEKMKQAGPAAAALPGLTTEDGLRRLMSRSGLVFPEQAVPQGKTWELPDEVPLPFGSMKVTKQFTYEGTTQEGGKPFDKIRSGLRVDEIKANPNANLTVEVQKQDSGGQILFNSVEGILEKLDVTQDLTLKLTVQGMDVISQATSHAVMTRVE